MKQSSLVSDSMHYSSIHEQKTFPEHGSVKEVHRPRLSERYPLMRKIPYSFSNVRENEQENTREKPLSVVEEKEGIALSLNLHSKGMLLFLDEKVEVAEVLKIGVPTPFIDIYTPTLAEVRWIKKIPFPYESSVLFVGVKFLV